MLMICLSLSQLQDIACSQCGVVLGIRCISSPVNHVLDEYVLHLSAPITATWDSHAAQKSNALPGDHRLGPEPA